MATKMSNEWTKDDIMAAYLNTIYFGRGAYGVAAASQAYFRKDVRKLTTEESAVLAASIRSPANYDPRPTPSWHASAGTTSWTAWSRSARSRRPNATR